MLVVFLSVQLKTGTVQPLASDKLWQRNRGLGKSNEALRLTGSVSHKPLS